MNFFIVYQDFMNFFIVLSGFYKGVGFRGFVYVKIRLWGGGWITEVRWIGRGGAQTQGSS